MFLYFYTPPCSKPGEHYEGTFMIEFLSRKKVLEASGFVKKSAIFNSERTNGTEISSSSTRSRTK